MQHDIPPRPWRIRKRMLTRLMAVSTMVAATTAGMAVSAPPASADASSWVFAPFGQVILTVRGEGTLVRTVRVGRTKYDPELICNFQAAWYVESASGQRLHTEWGPYQGKCVPVSTSWTFSPYRDFSNADGGKVCGSWYENGVKQGGSPCIRLRR